MTSVQQAIRQFLTERRAERSLSERTLRAYECDLRQFGAHLGARDAAGVTPELLRTWLEQLAEERYRYASIRRKAAALKIFFRYLEEEGVIRESPAKALRTLRPRRRNPLRILSAEETGALLGAVKAERARALAELVPGSGPEQRRFCAVRDGVILELLLSTGIRIGELVALDDGHVDLVAGQLVILGRGERSRTVPIEPIVREALGDYLTLRADRSGEPRALFIARSGGRLSIYSIENIFRKYTRLAGIRRRVTPYALRHTMASRLVGGGTDLSLVQRILGHASIMSTRVYERHARRKRRGR